MYMQGSKTKPLTSFFQSSQFPATSAEIMPTWQTERREREPEEGKDVGKKSKKAWKGAEGMEKPKGNSV